MEAHKPVCLIVDDAAVDREMMMRTLARQHPVPHVLTASSLAEARQHLARSGISLLFLDNMLPDGVGADFLSDDEKREMLGLAPKPAPQTAEKAKGQS